MAVGEHCCPSSERVAPGGTQPVAPGGVQPDADGEGVEQDVPGGTQPEKGGVSHDSEAPLKLAAQNRPGPSGNEDIGMLTGNDVLAFFQDQKCCRPSMPVEVLGSGAFARVMLLKDGCGRSVSTADGAPDTSVEACRMALKQGRWASQSAFEREVELQSRAAAAGLAPKIFFSTWLGGSGKTRSVSSACSAYLSPPCSNGWCG